MIVGYTYWMNYDLETNIKFSETGMYFDENGNSREIDIEFDVTILQNKYEKNYELLGDILIDGRIYSYGDSFGFLVYNIEQKYFVGFSPGPDNGFILTWNYSEGNGIIELYSDSLLGKTNLSGGVIYIPYDGESEDKILDKISYLKGIKKKIEYKSNSN